jgi:hypothetical protein
MTKWESVCAARTARRHAAMVSGTLHKLPRQAGTPSRLAQAWFKGELTSDQYARVTFRRLNESLPRLWTR